MDLGDPVQVQEIHMAFPMPNSHLQVLHTLSLFPRPPTLPETTPCLRWPPKQVPI